MDKRVHNQTRKQEIKSVYISWFNPFFVSIYKYQTQHKIIVTNKHNQMCVINIKIFIV